jgi:hypothetical protein
VIDVKVNALYTVNVVDAAKLDVIAAQLHAHGFESKITVGPAQAVIATNAPVLALHKARTAHHETKLLGLWAFKNLSPDAHNVRGPVCLEDAKI